jgi:urease accessory protein
VLRQTGLNRVHLVQAAGGPLGGDDLALNVNLEAGSFVQLPRRRPWWCNQVT